MATNRRYWLKNFATWIFGSALFSEIIESSSLNNKSNFMLHPDTNIKLGAFSISLAVKDLSASKEFYENIGFNVFAGGLEKKYLIMKNDSCLIGLFEGMFDKNILTFNPGWDSNAQPLPEFEDIRILQEKFKSKGIKLDTEIGSGSSGPASFFLKDPDGNAILFDQHL